MKKGLVVAAGVVVAAIAFFMFVPIAYSPIQTSKDQVAFLGSVPAYRSLSCLALGLGTGYWPTSYSSGIAYGQWSYTIGCPPTSYSPIAH